MWVDSCSTQLPLPPLVLCCVVSCHLSLSLSVSFFVSFSSTFLLFLLLLSASLYNTFLFSFHRHFHLHKESSFSVAASLLLSFLVPFPCFQPFHNKTLLYFLQAKKQGRARERDWETVGERHTQRQTQTFFLTVMWLRGRKQILLCFSWQWMFRTAGIWHC